MASRWIALPSSISAPSTPVPMISARSGSSTEKPKSPRICASHEQPAGWVARTASVSAIRTTAGIANSRARLRPSVARTVIDAITGLKNADMPG